MPLFRRSDLLARTAGAALLAAALAPLPAMAADQPKAKPAAKRVLKTAPATPRQQTKNAAKGLALATEVTEAISAAQLDVAARVLTGTADCEFKQSVTVQPVDGLPGYFHVGHLGKRYRMLPRETSTGAVRLEDPANGIVWLQIPTKSMLMDAKRGQRMIDSCLHSEQRAAVAAASAAGQTIGQGIGIVPQAAAAVPVATVVPVASVVPAAASASAPATDQPAPATLPSAALAPDAAASR
ncbi:MAG TPA: hypothetical protein PK306_18770 [Aquabacterium sp.]|nr:hypothetical protein [Aquabacterium sp.]